MVRTSSILLLFICLSNIVFGQSVSSKSLKGKIISEVKDLENIYVINLNTDKAVSTDDGGYFEINVAVGDTLMFSAVQIITNKVIINNKDFEKDLLLVRLEPMINKLDELIILKYDHINAYSLGILQKPAKSYTPAERKLKTASGIDIDGNTDGTSGVSAGTDPLFNWLSGRTAMLKKELQVERKELFLKQIENWFAKKYFTLKLNISEDYIMGFLYYAVENFELQSCLKSKNRIKTEFVFAKLATEFLELQKEK